MIASRQVLAILAFFVCAGNISVASAQDRLDAILPTEPPQLLLLRHREIAFDRAKEVARWSSELARTCDLAQTTDFWIHLQALTGSPDTMILEPFGSFEHWERSRSEWRLFYKAHPDPSRLNEQIEDSSSSDRTGIAILREDLGYLPGSINLSEMRYLRTVEYRIFPGHEREFEEGIKTLAESYSKLQADRPWIVYEMNVGAATPTFVVLVPLATIAENDELQAWKQALAGAEGEAAARRREEIARNAYAGVDSNLYIVRPDMSHVSKEFADADPDFWRPRNDSGVPGGASPARERPAAAPTKHHTR
jgi:hypothetical protein